MIPAAVHAALVALAIWGVHSLFALIGIELGPDLEQQLGEIIVAYILSLLGLGLFNRVYAKRFTLQSDEYHPPFV